MSDAGFFRDPREGQLGMGRQRLMRLSSREREASDLLLVEYQREKGDYDVTQINHLH